jgi:ParB-like chromosome segregation protein Spo0J
MNPPVIESDRHRSTRDLDGLTAHRLQSALFRPLSDKEHAQLIEGIRAHGVVQPFEITTDGTIIDGHERVRAARALGLTEIPVRVRDDLADQTAIDRRHAEANLNRRQLDPLDHARLAVHLFQLENGRKKIRGIEQDELRDRVGVALGMGGRNAQRYLNLARAPLEVQSAYSESKISLTIAGRVCQLPRDTQESLARELRHGDDPAIVVKRYLGKPSRPAPAGDTGQLLARAAKSIESALIQLGQVAAPADRVQTPSTQGVRDLVHMLERHHGELVALGETMKGPIAMAIELEMLVAERGCEDAG